MGLRKELVFAKTIVLLAKIEAFNLDISFLDKGRLSKIKAEMVKAWL